MTIVGIVVLVAIWILAGIAQHVYDALFPILFVGMCVYYVARSLWPQAVKEATEAEIEQPPLAPEPRRRRYPKAASAPGPAGRSRHQPASSRPGYGG